MEGDDTTQSDEGAASSRPPRDMLVRAMSPAEYAIRSDGDDPEAPPVLFGHFNRFGEWTEIDSIFEGHFMERFLPGSFKRTFTNNGQRMRPLFNHGQDNQLGNQVLGTVIDLREDDTGPYYEVELFRSVPALVMDGLKAGAYGSSFRFRVLREQFDREPPKSKHNPEGLPERSVQEAEVFEFGPVTFPQYEGSSAGVRSLTDEILFGRLTRDPGHLRDVIDYARDLRAATGANPPPPPVVDDAGEGGQDGANEDTAPTDPAPANATPTAARDVPLFGQRKGDQPEWML